MGFTDDRRWSQMHEFHFARVPRARAMVGKQVMSRTCVVRYSALSSWTNFSFLNGKEKRVRLSKRPLQPSSQHNSFLRQRLLCRKGKRFAPFLLKMRKGEIKTLFLKLWNVTTGNPGSVIVPQYGSSKITVFVWGKNTILKFLGNTK